MILRRGQEFSAAIITVNAQANNFENIMKFTCANGSSALKILSAFRNFGLKLDIDIGDFREILCNDN